MCHSFLIPNARVARQAAHTTIGIPCFVADHRGRAFNLNTSHVILLGNRLVRTLDGTLRHHSPGRGPVQDGRGIGFLKCTRALGEGGLCSASVMTQPASLLWFAAWNYVFLQERYESTYACVCVYLYIYIYNGYIYIYIC